MGRDEHNESGKTPDASDALEELVIECLERIESDGDAALEAVCAQHPDYATELRIRMSALRAAGLLEVRSGAPTPRFPERLGDFRLLAHLGGGGMGVVYLARQESLGREVALKLIRPEHLYFPGARERFRREVETVAKLAHPGIVPIYTVGEEHGIPYFAMERVEGCTLADVVDQVHAQFVSTLDGADFDRAIAAHTHDGEQRAPAPIFAGRWVEACVRITREAAEALEHVHRRGVLHRDVKPSNVMLTRSGRVMLVDFGLSSAEGVDRMTKSGSQLGSLPYMSPEQVRGDIQAIDARSDVYSLAVTLYELLTLRMPFADVKISELRRKIAEGRPPSIRGLNSSVEWDVETVCLHAMESDPSRRYASAADFAHDLTNVLEHRPIAARRASGALRARRWMQRHPAATVGLVLGSALLVGGPSVYAWQQRAANLAIAGKNTEIEGKNVALTAAFEKERELRAESDSQRARAERNFGAALEAVSTMLKQVGAKELENVPEMEETRRALLVKALEFFQRFVRDEGENRFLRAELAQTQRYIADISYDLGRFEDAEVAFKASIAAYRALHDEQPERIRHTNALSNAQISYARLLSELGRFDETLAIQGEAVGLARAAFAADPSSAELRQDLGHALHWRADVEMNAGRREDGLRDLDEVLRVCRNTDGTSTDDDELRYVEAAALTTLGVARYFDHQLDIADEQLRRALAIREQLFAKNPADRTSRVELAEVLAHIGMVHWGDEDGAPAEQAFRRAIDAQEALIRDFPHITRYREALNTLLNNLGTIMQQRHHDLPEGERLLVRAVEVLQPIVDERPNVPDYQFELGAALASLSAIQRDQGRLVEASETIERGLVCQRKAYAANPGKLDYAAHLRSDSIVAADVYLAREMHAQAAVHAREAREFGAGDWTTLALAATRLSKAIESALTDPALGEEERATSIERYTDESLDALRAAVETGDAKWEQIARSPYLDSVRTDPRFEQIDELARRKIP